MKNLRTEILIVKALIILASILAAATLPWWSDEGYGDLELLGALLLVIVLAWSLPWKPGEPEYGGRHGNGPSPTLPL